jgi:hypothetical protein
VNEIGSTGDKTVSTGNKSSSTGDKSTPTGDKSTPTGDKSVSTGDKRSSTVDKVILFKIKRFGGPKTYINSKLESKSDDQTCGV